MPETTIHLILQTPERRSDTVMDIHISTTPIFRWPGIHIHTSLKRKRKVSGLSLLFIQAVSPSLCLSFFGEDICLRQGWASLETWRPLALSATVAMERSRNGADKSWMRKLMFQRGPRVGGVSGTTLVTNVKLFWCMTESKNGREIRKKKTERESGEGERVRLRENSCESEKTLFLLQETELWEDNLKERELCKETGLVEVRKKMEGVKVLLQSLFK